MAWLCLGVLTMGLVETLGIASIMPFMAVMTNPGAVNDNKWLSFAYSYFEFREVQDFLFWLGLSVLGLLLISNMVSAGTMWLLLRFTNMRGHVLSERLLKKYLDQPYSFFLNRNGSELIKNTINQVNRFVGGIAIPFMGMLVKVAVIIFIFALLIAVDPVVALTVVVALGGVYSALFWFIRWKLARIGRESFDATTQRFKLANEAISGIKELKLLGREADYLRRYSVPSKLFAKHEATGQAFGILPRYAMEGIAFGGILLIVLYLIRMEKGASEIIPLVSLYAFAGYRLIPAVQSVFAGVTQVRYNLSTIELLYADLSAVTSEVPCENYNPGIEPIVPSRMIEMDRVTFTYPNSRSFVTREISLRIQANTSVGFVGSTGSGKTTLIDIILGLLTPKDGRLTVDGIEISPANVHGWYRSLGYVPQQIYLADDTVNRNIAFGVPDQDIDQEAVVRANKIANLHDFVQHELPQGYQTLVGDRGVRLSGGQRQRIGVARALYREPAVLILDEATSSLDTITEHIIMEAVHNLARKKTIIIVAHRLSTVKQCDLIYIVEKGQIAGQGTYDELIESNLQFRRMASVK